MNDLATEIPSLMSPVHYNGLTYFTGQYFHKIYQDNSDDKGKYKQTSSFLRLIRSIEAYDNYVKDGDIVEINWEDFKDGRDTKMVSLLKSNSYNPIMLINATAQLALSHHLDDEISKSVSVSVNRSAASATALPSSSHIKAAFALLDMFIKSGKLLGTEPAMAKAIGVSKVKEMMGIDISQLLIDNSVISKPMTPTELGKELGPDDTLSGQKINSLLEDKGFQIKTIKGEWEPTEKGKKFCTINPYKSPNSDHTGYRILWNKDVLVELELLDVA